MTDRILQLPTLDTSVSDATIQGLTLESSVTILEASFDDRNMFIVQTTHEICSNHPASS
jgi:hypothetical protein